MLSDSASTNQMMPQQMQIQIHELEVMARVGVTEEEQSTPQRLVLNISVQPGRLFSELGDDIAQAVNYSCVAREVHDLVTARRDKLIETLAEAIAMRLVELFPIKRAVVEVRKFVLPNAEYVSVTAVREAKAS